MAMKRTAPPSRFRDTGQPMYSLMDEILVVCPRCKAYARISPITPGDQSLFAPRRLICVRCGCARTWAEKSIRHGWWDSPVVDDFFGEPLWLQVPCEGHLLWAYNLRHLNLIAAYVGATLREHRRLPESGGANGSLLQRLPGWITAARNRAVVLRAVRRLRAKLEV